MSALALLRRKALAAFASRAGLSLPAAAAATTHPDARLLAFGAVLDAAEQAEKPLRDVVNQIIQSDPAEDCEEAFRALGAQMDRGAVVGHQILATPATTIDGLAVKARALAYIYHEGLTFDRLFGEGRGSTDNLLAWSIIADVLNATGAAHLTGDRA